jgi:hypothetical protein
MVGNAIYFSLWVINQEIWLPSIQQIQSLINPQTQNSSRVSNLMIMYSLEDSHEMV